MGRHGRREKEKSEAQVKQLSEPLLADGKRKLAEGDFDGCLEIYAASCSS